MSLKPGWKPSDLPAAVPESIRQALQSDAAPAAPPVPAPAEPTESVAASGLNPGWTADMTPDAVPASVRRMLAEREPAGQRGAATATTDCDVLICGGTVVDGTGAPPFVADVAVTGELITAVGQDLSRSMTAARTVDATGHIVTPGFCDIHTHCE